MSRSREGTWLTTRSPIRTTPSEIGLEPGDHAQRRRLAAARRADEHHELAVLDPEVERVHRPRAVRVDLADLVQRDSRQFHTSHRTNARVTQDDGTSSDPISGSRNLPHPVPLAEIEPEVSRHVQRAGTLCLRRTGRSASGSARSSRTATHTTDVRRPADPRSLPLDVGARATVGWSSPRCTNRSRVSCPCERRHRRDPRRHDRRAQPDHVDRQPQQRLGRSSSSSRTEAWSERSPATPTA